MAITEWEIRRAALGQDGIKILLCDDDPNCLEEVRHEVERAFDRLHMKISISTFRGPAELTKEALAACDLAFLDIDYDEEDQNGIDVARMLRRYNSRALIFFVTNYIDYAPEGYEVQAFRYILKRDMRVVLERYVLQALESVAEGRTVLCLRNREEELGISLEDISYLEVMDHYVSIHTAAGDHTLNATLSGMEGRLCSHGFLRIHKSFLVNMAHIRKFRSRECLLSDGTVLAVSEKNYSQQKQKYLLWKGRN